MWCQCFEQTYHAELKYLLEYKIELTETITYYSAREQFGVTKAIREFHSSLKFLIQAENQHKFNDIKMRLAKFQNIEGGTSQITFDIEWKEVKMAPLISQTQLLELQTKDQASECSNCKKIIK